MMRTLIASGNIALFILALTLGEILVLLALRKSRGWHAADFLPNILAGDFLLLAWWLSAAHWRLAAIALLGALFAHGTDMARKGYFFEKKVPKNF